MQQFLSEMNKERTKENKITKKRERTKATQADKQANRQAGERKKEMFKVVSLNDYIFCGKKCKWINLTMVK